MSPKSPYCNFQTFIFLWWKGKAGGREKEREKAEVEEVNWYSEVVCMCELGHGKMKLGIHYNGVSNIMIQAHARRVITAMGKVPGRRGWKGNVSAERARGWKVNHCRRAGMVGIKLISVFWEIHPVGAKRFHSAPSHTSFPPSESRAADRWDDPALPGETEIWFEERKSDFNSKCSIKWPVDTRDFLFSASKGKEIWKQRKLSQLKVHTGGFERFSPLNIN